MGTGMVLRMHKAAVRINSLLAAGRPKQKEAAALCEQDRGIKVKPLGDCDGGVAARMAAVGP